MRNRFLTPQWLRNVFKYSSTTLFGLILAGTLPSAAAQAIAASKITTNQTAIQGEVHTVSGKIGRVQPSVQLLSAQSPSAIVSQTLTPRVSSPAQPSFTLAQSITPATDGTGTVVNQTDNNFNVTGGTQTGGNLFHSFEQLGLTANETANILSSPDINNILGRVVGGNASVIDGLLQVTGSNANLFLVNPAGIIFGPNSQVLVPGAFTATTANGIQLEEAWFNALGANDYANMFGDPSGFAFTSSDPGAVINAGNISAPGESITLLGGVVVNTGTIETPSGTINISAVPGENTVEITPEGSLLTLALPADSGLNTPSQGFTASALPALLSGAGGVDTLGVAVEDGVVRLVATDTALPTRAGTAIASGTLDASDVAASGVGGAIDVLGNLVGVLNGGLHASGTNGGGNIRIGGDYQGNGAVANASRTYINEDSTIAADSTGYGDGGRVIVWADEATTFAGEISAQASEESGNGGFVEISGRDSLVFEGNVDLNATQGSNGTLLLDPRNIRIINGGPGIGDNDAEITAVSRDGLVILNNPLVSEVIPDFEISQRTLESFTSFIILSATETIIIDDLDSNTLSLSADSIRFDVGAQGTFSMSPDDTILINDGPVSIWANYINLGNISTNGGDISLIENTTSGTGLILQGDAELSSAGGDITINGLINGNHKLALLADSGSIAVNGEIGGITPLEEVKLSGNTISLLSNFFSLNAIPNITTSGEDIVLTGDLDLTEQLVLTTGGNTNGDIRIQDSIDGNEFVKIIAGNGRVQLDGALGNITQLENVEILAREIALPSELNSSENVLLDGEINLIQDSNIDVDGKVTFTGNVNGPYSLLIEGASDIQENVGNLVPLSSFSNRGSFSTPSLLFGDITTAGGEIKLSNTTQIRGDTVLGTGDDGGDISFDTIISEGNVAHSIVLKAGEGDVGSSSSLGSPSNPIGDVDVSGNRVGFNGINATGNVSINAQTDVDLRSIEAFSVAENLTIEAQGNILLESNRFSENSSLIDIGGNLALLANNTVELQDNEAEPLLLRAGSDIFITGEQAIRIQSANNSSSVIQSGGNTSLISDGSIVGNTRFVTGGDFSTQMVSGEPGDFATGINSLISSVGDVSFGDYSGLSLKIESQGSITGNSIEITGRNSLISGTDPDLDILRTGTAVVLRAGVLNLSNMPSFPAEEALSLGNATFVRSIDQSTPADITIGNISHQSFINSDGPTILTAPGTITVASEENGELVPGKIDSSGSIILEAGQSILTGDLETQPAAGVSLLARTGDIQVNSIFSGYGGVNAAAAGSFRAVGSFFDGGATGAAIVDTGFADFLVDEGYYNSREEVLEQELNLILSGEREVSILLRFADAPSDIDTIPITIRYGDGQNENESSYLINDDFSGMVRVSIQGDSTEPFVIGPRYNEDIAFAPSNPGDSIENFNPKEPFEFVSNDSVGLVFPSTEFPSSVSGLSAGIAFRSGDNSTLYGGVQSQTFGSFDNIQSTSMETTDSNITSNQGQNVESIDTVVAGTSIINTTATEDLEISSEQNTSQEVTDLLCRENLTEGASTETILTIDESVLSENTNQLAIYNRLELCGSNNQEELETNASGTFEHQSNRGGVKH